MPVTIAIYDCMGCSHCKDCPDYSDDRRFGWNGIRILPGAASIRCHHAQHDRRKDYSVDLKDMRLRELLTRFGFIDIGHDDGCLNRCRDCLRYDCPMNPVRYPEQTYDDRLQRKRERYARAYGGTTHRSGRAADFGTGVHEAMQQAYAKSDARFTREVYTDLRGYDISSGDTIKVPIDNAKTRGRYPYMHVEVDDDETPTGRKTSAPKYTNIHRQKYRHTDKVRKLFASDSQIHDVVKALKRIGLL